MRVTVVVPCFNTARFIGETLESALQQTHADTTVIVVDDGSTDGGVEIAEGFGGRVTVVRQQNAGPSAARNRAIAMADGDCIAFLDADDRWRQDKLARQLAFLADHDDCGLVHAGVRHIDRAGHDIARPGGGEPPPAHGLCLTRLLDRNTIITSTVIVRRGILGSDRFSIDLQAGEDWDLWLRLASRTRIGYVAETLVDYRLHDRNITRCQESMLRARLVVADRALARGLASAPRSAAKRHRRRVFAGLGHFAYEREDMDGARDLFRRAGPSLDGPGALRLIAASLPPWVRRPVRQCLRRLRHGAAV